MILTRISVFQPVFTTMVMVAVMLFGLISWRDLPVDRYPDVNFPIVAVMSTYSGATPETVEADVTKPLEEVLSTLSGLDEIRSTSREGSSMVILQFTLETDAAEAAMDVRDKVGSVQNQLPDDVEAPRVMRFDPTASPVLSLAISHSDMSRVEMTRLAEDVVSPALTAISGVGSVTVVGGVDEEVHIEIDPDLLAAYRMGISELVSAMRAGNLSFPGGTLDNGMVTMSVQLDSRAGSLDDIRDMVIRQDENGRVRLGDVAKISIGPSESSGIAYRDGQQAIALEVTKIEGGNTVELAGRVLDAVADLESQDRLDGARLSILANNATSIEESYETVKATLMEGAILAVAIVFLFLNSWRSTVITGFTLPISILGTLAVISALGFTLNSMTMLALTLSVGILIDDAIVVRENIMRHLHMGKTHRQAALDGTNEIGLAVLATTLSICAVFMPLAFMEGMVGQFFMSFGITVSVAVMISLFVSFTLDPMMSSVWHDPSADPDVKRGPVGRAIAKFDRGFEHVTDIYRRVLILCLSWRKLTMAVAIGLFIGSFFLVSKIGTEFVPQADEGKISVKVKTPVGSSQDYTAIKLQQVTKILTGRPEIEGLYGSVAAGSRSGANEASLEVTLVEASKRDRSAAEIAAAWRSDMARVPGAEISLSAGGGVGGGGSRAPISIRISGRNAVDLARGAEMISDVIRDVDGTKDVALSIDDSQPIQEYAFIEDLAREMGVNPQVAGDALRVMLSGQEVSEFERPDGITLPAILRLPEALREDVAQLATLPISSSSGHNVVLSEIAELRPAFGPEKIEREDRARVVKVTANIEGRLLGEVMAEINAGIAALDLPTGVGIGAGGDAERMAEAASALAMALGLAVLCIYLVLASQFGSFIQPFAIMMSLPLSLIGVVGGLLVGGSSLNMYSMIGFVMLMGLVVKNAILLVDNVNQRCAEGEGLHDAIISAGTTRFRPIVMTTLAMIFGMLPLALAIHKGSEESAGMAHAVIGGLISSTLLTLVVVPVVLTWIDALSRRIKGRFKPVH